MERSKEEIQKIINNMMRNGVKIPCKECNHHYFGVKYTDNKIVIVCDRCGNERYFDIKIAASIWDGGL